MCSTYQIQNLILAKFLIWVCHETETLIQINISITLSVSHPLSITHCYSTDAICLPLHKNSSNELVPGLAVFPNKFLGMDWIMRTLTSSLMHNLMALLEILWWRCLLYRVGHWDMSVWAIYHSAHLTPICPSAFWLPWGQLLRSYVLAAMIFYLISGSKPQI